MSDYCIVAAITTVVQSGVFCLAAFRSMAILTKCIAVWKVGFLAVLLMVVNSVPVSGNYELLISGSCDHFNLAEGQSGNAFYYDGRVCCLCKIGTKFTSVCNEDDPLSTGCDPCGKDEYRDFEPHMQPECEPQIEKYCKDPWVLSKGSITKATRCICKPGFRELGKMCVPIQKSIQPVTTPPVIIGKITENLVATKFTTTSMFIEPTTAPHKTTEGILTTTAYISTTVINGIETSASSDITDAPSLDITEKSKETSSGISLGVLILILLVVFVFFLGLILFCWKKYQDKLKKSEVTPTCTPVDSTFALVKCEQGSLGLNNNTNRVEEIVTTNGGADHEQSVVEVNKENTTNSQSSVHQPSVNRRSAVSENGAFSTHQEIEPLLRNVENDSEQKNMAAPTESDPNPDRIRRELPLASGDDIRPQDHSQQQQVNGNIDPRLPFRHKDIRSLAIARIVKIICIQDINAIGHWMIVNFIEFDDIKVRHERDGSIELATQVFRRGLELRPNLSLYDFYDKVRELGLGYLQDVFEDCITKLEDPESQPE